MRLVRPLLWIGAAGAFAVVLILLATGQQREALPGVLAVGIIYAFMLVLAMWPRRRH